MSGYHPDTGVFELTATKAAYWLRRTDFPDSCNGVDGMRFYAALLNHFGHKILTLRTNYLHVHATPGQVWEALSGRPSDPAHEQIYVRKPAPGGSSKPVTREGVRLLPESALELFLAGVDGNGRPLAKAIASGRSACRVCGELIIKGADCLHGGYDFSNGRNGPQPTKCYVHRECLTNPG